MASKRRQARARATPAPAQPQSPQPSLPPSAFKNVARLISLMGAIAVGLLVYELLQPYLPYWLALLIGLVACIPARAALLWLERVWLRAAARKAARRRS